MDLDHLRTFLSVAETGGVTAAARRLGLPKSSVSRGLAAAERAVGAQLVERSSRAVRLTAAGRRLHERASPLLAALEAAVAGAAPEPEARPAGVLRVTTTVDFGTAVLADVVARFVARHPAVEVDMHLTNDVVDLTTGGFDAALRLSARALGRGALRARRVSPLRLQLFAAPEYLARRGSPRAPDELSEHDGIVYGDAKLLALDGPAGRVRVSVRRRVATNDMFFAREVARAGTGIALLPSFLAEDDVRDGRLARVLPSYARPTGFVWFVWPGGDDAPLRVRAFRDFVVEALGRR